MFMLKLAVILLLIVLAIGAFEFINNECEIIGDINGMNHILIYLEYVL